MGYLTYYNLKAFDTNEKPLSQEQSEEIIGQLLAFSDDAEYAIDESGDSSDSCKWYDHDKELRAFSTRYPDVLFRLSGEGEEQGDLWQTYYLNGKAQECPAAVVYPAYSPAKLA